MKNKNKKYVLDDKLKNVATDSISASYDNMLHLKPSKVMNNDLYQMGLLTLDFLSIICKIEKTV